MTAMAAGSARWPRAMLVGCLAMVACADAVDPDAILDVRLTVATPEVRAGERLDAEVAVTNRGRHALSLPGAECPSQIWVRDAAGNATGQQLVCLAGSREDLLSLEPGETTAFPRFWSSLGAWPGQYFAVAYVTLPGGAILFSDTVAVSVEPDGP